MEGVRVKPKPRVSGLEPESRATCSSQRLLRASSMTALIIHPGSRLHGAANRPGLLSAPRCTALLPQRLAWLRLGLGCSSFLSSAPTPP